MWGIHIDKKVWEDFVKSRTTLDLSFKRQKRKENKDRNIYPHRFSCGGYDKLDEKIINEKWKRARQRPGGEFTSEDTSEVAEKIVIRYFFNITYFS